MTPTVTRISTTAHHSRRRVWTAIVSVLAVVVTALSLSAVPASAAPQSVSGTVSFGTAGNHPADAVAVVTWQRYETNVYVAGPKEGVRTDSDGRYTLSLEPGTYKLRFAPVAGGYQAVWWGGVASQYTTTVVVVGNAALTAMDIILPPLGSLSGRVFLGDTDTPAGAGQVQATTTVCHDGACAAGPTAMTDASGAYAFTGLSHGDYAVRFEYLAGAEYQAPTTPVSATVSTEHLELTGQDVTMPATPTVPDDGASLSGTARNEAGAPIAGVQVTAWAYDPYGDGRPTEAGSIRTAADGTYAFAGLPPAAYVIEFWIEEVYAKTARYDLILTAGEARTGFDVTMRLYASISGTITCERCDEADVAEGLYVEFERSVGTRSEPAWVYAGGVWAEATDEADGAAAYTFSTDNGLVPGTYRAQVVGDWGWRTRANLSPAVTVADGADVTLDLAAEFLQFDRDFSGDDHPDVIARTGAGALLMYSGDGASGWSGVGTIGSGWSVMNHVFAAGDFSGDGHEDVMARDSAGRLHLYRGDGKGGWLGWGVVGTGWGHMTAIFSPGDFSGDGNADVMARDGVGDLWLYAGDGKGGWSAVYKVGTGWNTYDQIFAAGDFGGYGEANIMGRNSAGDLYVYQADGWGGWVGQYRAGTGWGVMDAIFGAGDFDGDGWDDVMGRDASGRLWLYPGNGGLFKLPKVVGTAWSPLTFVKCRWCRCALACTGTYWLHPGPSL